MPALRENPRLHLSLMQILLCMTTLGIGYAMMQSTTLVVLMVMLCVVVVLVVSLTAMIVLLLTIIEFVLYASEYLVARGQAIWMAPARDARRSVA